MSASTRAHRAARFEGKFGEGLQGWRLPVVDAQSGAWVTPTQQGLDGLGLYFDFGPVQAESGSMSTMSSRVGDVDCRIGKFSRPETEKKTQPIQPRSLLRSPAPRTGSPSRSRPRTPLRDAARIELGTPSTSRRSPPSRTARARRLRRLPAREVVVDGLALGGVHVQAALGAAPQDVVGGLRPLVGDEALDLALGEAGAEVAAELLGLRDVAQDQSACGCRGGARRRRGARAGSPCSARTSRRGRRCSWARRRRAGALPSSTSAPWAAGTGRASSSTDSARQR